MLDHFPFYLALLLAIVILIMTAKKIKVAYPVLLVLAGLGLSFLPGIPNLQIDHELIFVVFLPPLLYEAAWAISWKELWRWRRIIGSFAFVVVFFSALVVALIVNRCIPGFTLPLGFLLGGIVSPPDAVSAGSIMKFVRVPKRFSCILEGESLLNDASSLIIFRFALITVATGQFIWSDAIVSFGWMVIGGIGIGLAVAFAFKKFHKYLPTDANIDTVLSLVAPYVMYLSAEELHSSGVLATVSGGLFLSTHRHSFLSSTSRLREHSVWESLSFILNGLVFTLIGLELPEITRGLDHEGIGLGTAIGYGLLVTFVLVIGRMISAYSAVIITLIARNFITVADSRHPGFKVPILLGWCGMRGVVSLAAALSIPVTLADGSPFPQRNLILFITFVVILITLVGQGLTLPYLIRKIDLPDMDHALTEEEEDHRIKTQLSAFTLAYLKEHYGEQLDRIPVLQDLARKLHPKNADEAKAMTRECVSIYKDMIAKQRAWLIGKNEDEKLLDEDIIRKHLLRLDLEEEKLKYL
ncbi:Na+/H+ antiporter [Flavobacterium sp. MAH-1]|uniref:Na+/H+ antiporter n=1 Tax=Flavobacterium agri TaxID=2743471 RepID=A0A7Y9C5Z3_9FLAO|nr:Na+/H+ antiporter [Flavobacterium agri]NUY81466.1 Na+/H+ antiporter [Flavobacterium agri]NYA71490.1 Na+/H+ antiporter [Flavobacterium agri]